MGVFLTSISFLNENLFTPARAISTGVNLLTSKVTEAATKIVGAVSNAGSIVFDRSGSYEVLENEESISQDDSIESLKTTKQPGEAINTERTGWKKVAYKVAYLFASICTFGIVPLFNWLLAKNNPKSKPEAPEEPKHNTDATPPSPEEAPDFIQIMALGI